MNLRITLAEMSTSLPFSSLSSFPVAKHPVSQRRAAVKGPFCLSPSVYTSQTCCLSFEGPSIRSVCTPMCISTRVCMCVRLCVYMYTCVLLICHIYVPAHAQTCAPRSTDLSIPEAVSENCVLLSDSMVHLTRQPASRSFTPENNV